MFREATSRWRGTITILAALISAVDLRPEKGAAGVAVDVNRAGLSLAHRTWRLLPAGMRRRAMTRVAGLVAPRPPRVPPAISHGVVVAGDVEGANGLAESARLMHDVLAGLGVARGLVPLGLPSVVPALRVLPPADAALLAVVNAPFLPVGLARAPRGLLHNRRVIGLFAWELPAVPPDWHEGARFVHEIWAPSRFCAAAFEPLAPGRVRVVPHPLAALPDLPVEGVRADFGLPEDALIVLVVANIASSHVRKNPEAAIRAFRLAFGDRADRHLVLKLAGTDACPEDFQAILREIGAAPNVTVITEVIAEPRLRGLIAASDIVLSLHRAEGFGLVPATAMLLARPVVATGWSGNMDFMDAQSAALVGYRLVAVDDPRGVYAVDGAVWAEPDIADAAAQLQRLAGDKAARTALAIRGREHARQALGAGPVQAALAASGIVP